MYERDGVWHICIRHNGRKIQRSLKIPVGKKEHKKIAKDMESKIRVKMMWIVVDAGRQVSSQELT